ncbi:MULTISPECIES: pentapeptide repeat-containing protein [unclassified Pseudomonas]|uniref:pentapeptide repeat-containing protein n=1 Tax=unclassified Pseudomonas TaxID=196821 RepID=UPI0015A28A9E|nr:MULTISPECIES: pentapeptide repeat-containing protein [unclassified Pseudomonas]NWB60017.1 pentapeptide repeat-containing protein [Pseudomonas sp. F1002]NWC05739.1 pentapeptide repeat-containing protein [Pseudomonas sp. G1002]
MQGKDLSITPSKPKSVFARPLNLNFADLAKALVKGVGHALTGRFEELPDDGIDALSAIGIDENGSEALTYKLLERSLQSAIFSLIIDSKEQISGNLDITQFTKILEHHIETIDVNVDFFETPNKFPVITATAIALAEWLMLNGIENHKAKTISARLPGYFPFALHKEWQSSASAYEIIRTDLMSPFLNSVKREAAWDIYHASLNQRLDESLFGEPFGLRQIYIPLNCYYDAKLSKSEIQKNVKYKKRVVVKLIEELDQWLDSAKKDDSVRAISGGPGSGKSSFAKIYAAHIASQNKTKVLFIPLHYIDPTRDFIEEVGRFVRDEGILQTNPLSKEGRDSELLIILDGLDELSSQGRAAASTARNFVRSVQQTVDRLNMHSLNLRVIFSGREVVMQDSESEFRQPRQILTILPYFSGTKDDRAFDHNEYEDPLSLLDIDYRPIWWNNYRNLTGLSYKGIPQELDRPDLVEITSQPLLNYLLALSFCRGKLNFSSGVNLNQIYDDLVQAVYERGYENGRKPESIRRLDSEDFVLILEEIGLAAWHGDGRTTTVSEIESYCRAGGFGEQLDAFQEGAKVGIASLLAAFFFRQHGSRPQGDPTFVFTHKSFGEYLAARRIVRSILVIIDEMDRRENIGRGRGWDSMTALVHWAEISGPTALSENIHNFLRSEILLLSPAQTVRVQYFFTVLFNHVLKSGMPIEKITKIETFHDALHNSRNSEEALLAALNSAAIANQTITKLDHPDAMAFGSWFKRIQKQRFGPESCLAASCLSWLDLSHTSLDFADFYGADISHSDFSHCQAFRVIFGEVTANNANFQDGIFTEGYFSYSSFINADFRKSLLAKVDFEGSNCTKANFSNADVSLAFFQDTSLKGSLFRGSLRRETKFPTEKRRLMYKE